MSTVRRTFAQRSQGDFHPRIIVGRMDVRELRLQDRQNTVGRGIGNKVKRKPTRG
jgi:hypothetical protein